MNSNNDVVPSHGVSMSLFIITIILCPVFEMDDSLLHYVTNLPTYIYMHMYCYMNHVGLLIEKFQFGFLRIIISSSREPSLTPFLIWKMG